MKKEHVIAKEFDYSGPYGKPERQVVGSPADSKKFGPVQFKRLVAEGFIVEKVPAPPEVTADPAPPEVDQEP